MQKRQSDSYLIISSVHLGASEDILSVYSNIAKKYKANVIHLGPTVSIQEYNEYNKLSNRIKTLNKSLKYAESDRYIEKINDEIETAQDLLENIEKLQYDRVDLLKRYFKKMTFVTNKELSLIDLLKKDNKINVIEKSHNLSKYLILSPVPPTGDRAVRNPINTISKAYLKELGKNWIVAHPVPYVECSPRPETNEAYNYFTVGSLIHQYIPSHTKKQYAFAHMPCAILVVLDQNGEFHARQMHIDYSRKKRSNRQDPMVLDDGYVFTANEIIEVGSEDKANATFDDHSPYTHPGVLGAIRALNELHKPDLYINGGDASNFDSVDRHALEGGMKGDLENKRIKDDLFYLHKLLKLQTECPSIKKKVLIDSNHHEWLTKYINKNPALIGMLDWETLSKTMFTDWELIIRKAGDSQIFYFGDIAIRHGDRDGGVKRAESIFPLGKYLCGHFHHFVSYRRAVQVGCGAMLGPKYLDNGVTAWQNQIVSLTKYQEIGAVNPKIVIHDKKAKVSRFCYRNNIYEVDHFDLR